MIGDWEIVVKGESRHGFVAKGGKGNVTDAEHMRKVFKALRISLLRTMEDCKDGSCPYCNGTEQLPSVIP